MMSQHKAADRSGTFLYLFLRTRSQLNTGWQVCLK